MMKGLLITSGLMLLSGCIPAPLGRYYKPVYPEAAATYSGDLCYGQAGAPAVLKVPLADGVTFTVRTTRNATSEDGARQLHLSVRVPPGVRFRFLAPRLVVHPDDTSTPADELRMEVSSRLRLPARERIDPSRLAPTPLTSPQGVPVYQDYVSTTGWTPAWGEGFVPQSFTMTLPTLLRPGQPDLPLVVQAHARQRPERFKGE